MKKFNRGLLCLILSCIMMTESVVTVHAVTKTDLQQQINNNQKQLNSVTGQLSSLESQQDLIAEQIDDVNSNLVDLYTSIDVLQDQITEKESEISKKEQEIVKAQAEYEKAKKEEQDQYEAMKTRVRFMYEQGDTGYIEMLLGSKSLSDMLDKTEYIEDVYQYDRKMLKEYQNTKEAVAKQEKELENEKQTLETDETALEKDKSDLVSQQDYLNGVLTQKKKDNSNYEAEIADAQKQAQSYKSQIASDSKKLSDIQEEEKRKMAAAAAGTTGGSSSSTNASSATTIAAALAIVASASGSSAGKAAANYACKFVGNPYVAGGTSLTNGADCSGFIYRVYADFGYSVSRNSYSLRTAGTGVSYAEAQPGDIICYDGHVAMYIGNGQIVHASSARTGIKIGNAQYREILAVRRIVS